MISLDVNALANRVFEAARRRPEKRYIVAIGGIPGSGKSTVAVPLVDRLNALAAREDPSLQAILLGVDGWHYSQAQLRSMPDSEMLFQRRGADFTFDGPSYAAFVKRLDEDAEVPFPTFSHRDKDPIEDGGAVLPRHRIVVIEGLHALLNIAPWSEAALRYDDKVWVNTPMEVATQRIVTRHVRDGVEPTLEAARSRAEGSDMTLQDNLIAPTVLVEDNASPATLSKTLHSEAVEVLAA